MISQFNWKKFEERWKMKFESIKISKIRDLLSFAFKTELLFSVWK